MKTFETATVAVMCVAIFSAMPAAAADDSKVKDAARQVESGAKTTGVEGSKTAGNKIKDAGRAAEPEAKNAWWQFKDSASSFGHSVKNFFKGLGS